MCPSFEEYFCSLLMIADVHIQRVVFGIEHRRNLHIHIAHPDCPEPGEPADAEIFMHDIVAFAELLDFRFGDSFEAARRRRPWRLIRPKI